MTILDSLPNSKAAVCRAFVELLKELPYSAIRVTDLCARSGVGRTTFYMYYKDKSELLEDLENMLLEGFMALVGKARSMGVSDFREKIFDGVHPVFVEYFSYIRANGDAFTVLVRPQEEFRLVEKMIQAFTEVDLDRYTASYETQYQPLINQYRKVAISNYVGIFVDWIKNGMELSDTAMARLVATFWRRQVFIDGPDLYRYLTSGESGMPDNDEKQRP